MFLVTYIGSAWTNLFPPSLRSAARIYLAPSLGLATLTILAGLLGWFLPMGDTVLLPIMLAIILVLVGILQRRNIVSIFYRALSTGMFGLICGITLLVPLLIYGGFNSHNDAFTYLVHSNWLQDNAFGSMIPEELISPLSTQVALYQKGGLRMGASFFLGFIQALLNLKWSYEVYPAAAISAVAVGCYAIGFPLAIALRSVDRRIGLLLLCLPAFSLGGLVFGANLGFLPQTFGLALGAGLLFSLGPLSRWLITQKPSAYEVAKTSLPLAFLFSSAVLVYSELSPLLLIAVLLNCLILGFRFGVWRRLLIFNLSVILVCIFLLNTELFRTYQALKAQSGVSVGTPVDWPFVGFAAHALGLQGGAWDLFQWSALNNWLSPSFFLGITLLICAVVILLSASRALMDEILSGAFLPSAIILLNLFLGIVYFRYFVASPFPLGVGQSWSQFKLSEWAHPFAMLFVIFSITQCRKFLGKYFNYFIISLFVAGLIGAIIVSIERVAPLAGYYGNTHDLSLYYRELRQAVLKNCPKNTPIYIDLGGENHKFRQMAAYYLGDRDLASDWSDDGYIFPQLLPDRITHSLNSGDCVVELNSQDGLLSRGTTIGTLRVGVFDAKGQIRITSVSGAHGRETDNKSWWHWVERKIVFILKPLHVPQNSTQVKLNFEYATRGKQKLRLSFESHNGVRSEVIIQSPGDALIAYEKILEISPAGLESLTIETDGSPSRLGEHDGRMASFIVRNVSLSPVNK